jgi:hypothetical protein
MNVVNNVVDATEIPVTETTKEKPVMSEETKSESVVVVKPETTEPSLLSRIGSRVAEVAQSKGAHVMVANAAVGLGVGLVGGAFGPIGASLTLFGFITGNAAATGTQLYLMEETLEGVFNDGRKRGALEKEVELLRAQAKKNS